MYNGVSHVKKWLENELESDDYCCLDTWSMAVPMKDYYGNIPR